MNVIKRIYVEKKPGCDIQAANVFSDIKNYLRVEGLDSVRVLNRYDIEGISSEHYEQCKRTVFSEPAVDVLYEEDFPHSENDVVFAVKYLPGQYDQRADSAMQCVQIITQADPPMVESAVVYVCSGRLSTADINKIKEYYINPVDSMESPSQKPENLRPELEIPGDVKTFEGFIQKDEIGITDMREKMGLAMSGSDLLFCRDYFRDTENRNPTETEIKVIDTYWSDHCRHTTFLTEIESVAFEPGIYNGLFQEAYDMYIAERTANNTSKPLSLMDLATVGMKALKRKGILDDLDESGEINACSIVVNADIDDKDEQWLVMFKNETHNHPTEIEPYGGAATCLGGAIRDPLSGRSYVYQAMRVTGSGNPYSDAIPGKLPQRRITTGAADGFSSYGNQVGLATGQVVEIYDEGYMAKRMEIGAVIGAAPKAHVVRQIPSAGDVVILVGGRTGRDGCGGATGSSKEHTEQSLATCAAEVQKGNPPTERKLQRLYRNPQASRLIKRCNDFGAGGVCVAIGELADGLDIDLDMVSKKYDGLDGTELAISESQERMAVVVAAGDAAEFIKHAEEENLEATVVAVVTDTDRLVMKWRDAVIVDISRDFLNTNGASQYTTVVVTSPGCMGEQRFSATSPGKPQTMTDTDTNRWLENLKNLNVASQKGLSEMFGSTIGAATVLMPFGGKSQLTPAEVMAAKLPVLNGNTNTTTLMSYGYNPEIFKWSPFHGAVYAVVEAVSKIVASGGGYSRIRMSFQEYFERMTADPIKWGKPFSALLGGFYAQMMLGIPSIGGKDSMSGTYMDINVPPTLVAFAVDVCKADNVISPEFKQSGHLLLRLDIKYDERQMPDFSQLKNNYDTVTALTREGRISAASTIGFGGAAAAISKMAAGNNIGADIKCDDLYDPHYGAFILELDMTEDEAAKRFSGCNFTILGNTIKEPVIIINGITIQLDDIVNSWMEPLEKVFPTKWFDTAKKDDISVPLYQNSEIKKPAVRTARPRIFIPVFPGTNCEYDTKKAFDRAGGLAETFVLKNLNLSMLGDSIKEMVKMIRASQIIAIPGGFSAGDEPDGSAKFITAVFRNPYIKEAVEDLLNNRDGLMLGICNGFQALVKLGLAIYGDIRDMEDDAPTLTYNEIGRHISCLARTKIISNKSPWLYGVNAGDEHLVAVTHCEGRFMANEASIKRLIDNNQIATQYVDTDGKPSYDIRHNPNGSIYAIEGIISPDGRIFGKMGHSERIGDDLYRNIPGEKNQKIFESGVNYFK